MKHLTLPSFWRRYQALPKEIQRLADKSFQLLKTTPHHPSLHFKEIGKQNPLWSVRIGKQYRGHWGVRSQKVSYGSGLAHIPNIISC